MSIVVTGGAGFIGSCMVRTLNDSGVEDIIIVDNIASTDKWLNIRNKKYREYVHKNLFLERLKEGFYDGDEISAIIHMGACSATTEMDFDYLYQNNFEYTKTLWNYCKEKQISFLYASSAATYGDGKLGFDDETDIKNLRPMNGYGYSKQIFDLWVEKQNEFPKQYVGFKFFNVYGPNEYFKGNMASMLYHGYKQICESGKIRLFKSANPNYADGGQLRDFVYVKDICNVMMYMLEHTEINGLYNVGTGCAQSFRELAESVFAAMGKEPVIEYIDMPDVLREKYQYHTQATMEKLYKVGYHKKFCDLKEGAKDYVENYLNKQFEIY